MRCIQLATTMKECLTAPFKQRYNMEFRNFMITKATWCRFGMRKNKMFMKSPLNVSTICSELSSDIAALTSWTVCYNYFIYRPNDTDENHNYIHVVNLDKENATFMIEDFLDSTDCILHLRIFNYFCYRSILCFPKWSLLSSK